ncbi:DUF3060 domain-containing protein [Rathayibacter sp. YIM 133350]|uniref:DUF3060 domain-containing protein n=1 Tax=Rathayibacter sp. YIM 133350 TaxID=3131992 RepID=UPI00307D7DEC
MRRVSAGAALAAMIVLLLTGCLPGRFLGGDRDGNPPGTPQSSAAPIAPRDQDPFPGSAQRPLVQPGHPYRCADGQELALEGQALHYEITGECGRIAINGQALVIEIASATAIALSGQAVTVTVDSDVDALQISGDANTVDAGSIRTVSISGQGNVVSADTLGALSVNGDKNSIRAENDPSPSSLNGQGNTVTRR